MENNIIKGTSYSEYEAMIKLLVLDYSVRFENLASDYLKIVMRLDDSAVSLGSTSQALTMNQKLVLLLDSKMLEKDSKKYFRTFFNIRNQFVHNASVKSFEDCLLFLDGAEKFMEKAFISKKIANEKAGGERAAKEKRDNEENEETLRPFDISDKEKQLFKYWISLAEDVVNGFENMKSKAYIMIGKYRKT